MLKKFPHYLQTDFKDCGPTCLKIIAKSYGKNVRIETLRKYSETNRTGSSLFGLSDAAEKIGFRSIGVRQNYEVLEKEMPLPCIAHWNKAHFVVIYKIKNGQVHISDPAHDGLLKYKKEEFLQRWIGNNSNEYTQEGIVLLLEPTPKLYTDNLEADEKHKYDFSFVSKYLLKYKKFILQLIFGLASGSLLQLIVPFLTQSIVDVGITNRDINFIYLILFAQVFLFLGKMGIDIIRSWILLHLSTRINISLISDFFMKLMNLPISYFDSKMTGDLLQRINDHRRIERLLTTSSLDVLFSLINLIVLSFVIIWYSLQIFTIFMIGSVLYFGWIVLFLKKRAELDYKQFSVVSQEQSKVIELINGMQEIKLHNAEKKKRWSWEFVQARLFKVAIKNLSLEQTQSVGSSFINELKNILITIVSAKLVIDGDITLGMMLAISYIVGQMNSPVSQLIGFVRELQDAKISLDRLSEIHNKPDEENLEDDKIKDIPENGDFNLNHVSFRYSKADEFVLEDLSTQIPANKITAVVGVSGSGKTTLMKLLLRFYDIEQGSISVANYNLNNISQGAWRDHCGVVMQEGYIFNDTIANNIAVGEESINRQRLENAVDIANIKDYIESLPLTYNTQIGMEGTGLSTGQKQRLLIARAVYKNPKVLFFDEATSALDANNEKIIMEKLNTFFDNKTVMIIAHRLSTVKNAHQIIVLDKGKIVEVGNHKALVAQKGHYYRLVKNQLELGT